MRESINRNGAIDIQKFFYSWIIVIFHFYLPTSEHIPGGGTSVEFFLIASGAFFFAGYKRRTANMDEAERLSDPVKYIKRRILRFLPYTIPTVIAAFIIKIVITDDGFGINRMSYIIDAFVKRVWELALVSMCGLNGGKGLLNGVTWTISAMLIVEFVILSVLVRKEKTFCAFLAPVTIIIGLGFWTQTKDTSHLLWHGFTTFGVIRAYIMTCAGIYAWKCAQWLSNKRFTVKGKAILTVVELGLHLVAVTSMMYRSNRYYRMFLALLFAAAVAITLSQQSYTAKWFRKNRFTSFLGEWSVTIYVTHHLVMDLLYRYFETPYEFYRIKFIYGALVVTVSLMLLYFARWLTHTAPKVTAKMRSVLINNEPDPKIR